MNNKAMYKLTYGLFVLTAKDGDKDNGCIINTAMQVTTNPNRIIITVNKENLTHDMVKRQEFLIFLFYRREPDLMYFKTLATKAEEMWTRWRQLPLPDPKTVWFTCRIRQMPIFLQK